MVKGCIYLKSFLSSYSNVHCTLQHCTHSHWLKSTVSHSESVLTHLEILKCSKKIKFWNPFDKQQNGIGLNVWHQYIIQFLLFFYFGSNQVFSFQPLLDSILQHRLNYNRGKITKHFSFIVHILNNTGTILLASLEALDDMILLACLSVSKRVS